METLLTAEEVLTVAEGARGPARIGGLDSREVADFRHAVRYAVDGAVVHVPAAMAQTDHYVAVAQLADGTRLYRAVLSAAPSTYEWSRIAN